LTTSIGAARLFLNDADLELMATVFESKQHLPMEVLNRVYIAFQAGMAIITKNDYS
jgi:hypothetical protein